MSQNAVVLWTGGKDSALALFLALKRGIAVKELVTFAPVGAEFLAHPLEVMSLQAAAMGFKHRVLTIEAPYEEAYRKQLEMLRGEGVDTLITGDIDEVGGQPNFIRTCAEPIGLEVWTPLWKKSRWDLMGALLAAGFQIIFSCVKPVGLTPTWVGRKIDRTALEELAQLHVDTGLDVCGEQGEYHTLVLDGPGFKRRLELSETKVINRGDLAYLQIGNARLLLPSEPPTQAELELALPKEMVRPTKVKNCSQCGKPFFCGPGQSGGECWCQGLPHVGPIAGPDVDCMCPQCFREKANG